MKNKLKKISVILGILLMSYSLIHIGENDIKNGIDKIGAYIICISAVGLLLFICKCLFIKITEQNYINKKGIILGTIIIFLMINLIIPYRYRAYEKTPLEIKAVATGDKNILSKGTEVWIKRITLDGQDMQLKDLEEVNGWEFKNNKLVSYQNQPQELKVVTNHEEIEIELIKHPYSGKVVVAIGNENQNMDLYAESETVEIIKVNSEHKLIKSVTIMVYIGYCLLNVINGLLITLIMVILLKNRIKFFSTK